MCSGFVKNRLKWTPALLHYYLKHHDIYSYNLLFSKVVQMNCPDISKSKFQFLDKNNLFACLVKGLTEIPNIIEMAEPIQILKISEMAWLTG